MNKLIATLAAVTIMVPGALAKTYHVSRQGEGSNPGTETRPFRTIQKAADSLGPGDTCIVHAGVYRETVTIKRSGEPGKPIRFQAAPGEVVTIHGCDPITSRWQPHEGDVLKTNVDRPVRQLLVGERPMIEARWPNMSFDDLWSRDRWAKAGTGSRYGKMIDPALAEAGFDATGALATLNVAHQFYTWSRTVEKHEPGLARFDYTKDLASITNYADRTTHWEDDRYYLSGKLAFLDAPGEWFYEDKSGTLYLRPPEAVELNSVAVGTKNRAYAFRGRRVKHVEIAGFRMVACTFGFQQGQHLTIEDCRVRYPDAARRINDPEADAFDKAHTHVTGDDNTVRRCWLAYGPTVGIRMEGRRNTLDDCLLHDFCWNGSLKHPVIAINSGAKQPAEDRCVVRRCTVYNGGNALINYRGLPGHILEYNHFYNGGLCCKDIALVYTGQPTCAGSIVRYNWVHGCYTEHRFETDNGSLPGGLGIRGDDQTRSLTVHHNVVWDCGRDGIIVKGDHNRVHHNTVLDIGTAETPGNYINLHNSGEPKKWWREQYPLLEVQNANSLIANNVAQTIVGHNRTRPFKFPENMQANHTGESPLLRDPEGYDFRPRKGSPLIDAAVELPGFNDDYVGEAADIGAYEFGGVRWKPGISWDPNKVLGHVPAGYESGRP